MQRLLLIFAIWCAAVASHAANDPIEFHAETGLTLTAELYTTAGLASSPSLTESPGSSGRYIVTAATLSGLGANTYGVRIIDGSDVLYGSGELRWSGSAEILPSTAGDSMAIVAGGVNTTSMATNALSTQTQIGTNTAPISSLSAGDLTNIKNWSDDTNDTVNNSTSAITAIDDLLTTGPNNLSLIKTAADNAETAAEAAQARAELALPPAAPDAAGGLPISDAGGLDLDSRLDVDVSTRAAPSDVASALTTYDAPTKAEMDNAISGLTPTAETRDLQKVQHLFALRRASSGALQSTEETTLYVSPGSSGLSDYRCGINCEIPSLLPGNAVLGDMGAPTCDNDEFTLTELGIGPDGKGGPLSAKFELDVDANPTEGTTWITTTISNDQGGGPIPVYVKVVVEDAPTP